MRPCPKCKTECLIDFNFCNICGTKLNLRNLDMKEQNGLTNEQPIDKALPPPPPVLKEKLQIEQSGEMQEEIYQVKMPHFSSLLMQSPEAKIGLIMAFIGVIGLVVAVSVPWVMVSDKDVLYTADYDIDMEKSGSNNERAPEELFADFEEAKDFFARRASSSITGFIIIILLAAIIVFSGAIANALDKKNRMNVLFLMYGSICLIPATMLLISGMSFIGLSISHSHNGYYNMFPINGIIISIFGFIFAVIGVVLCRRNFKFGFMNFRDNVKRIISIILLFSILGLITMPLLPWLEVEEKDSDSSLWLSEGEILAARNVDNEAIDYKQLGEDINSISILFWLCLIMAITGHLGITTIGRFKNADWIGNILLLVSSIIILFSILLIWEIVNFWWHVSDYENYLVDAGKDTGDYRYFFNYFPMVFAFLLLLSICGYLIVILPVSVKVTLSLFSAKHQQNIVRNGSAVQSWFCSHCGFQNKLDAIFCGKCRTGRN